MNSSTGRTPKTAAVLAVATCLMTFGAGAASAHVGVTPDSTSEGGFSQLTFRVPNESQTAKTTKLTVTLPSETPFTSVSVKPMDGWTVEVLEAELAAPITVKGATITKAPASVVWTADEAHQISQRQYQTFSISVGRLPHAGNTVLLPAAQTYSDGTVVNWSEAAVAGQAKPEHPAPSFITTPPAGAHGAEATADIEAASATSAVSHDAGSAALGWAGLGTGLLGLAAGATALAKTRRVDKG
ncbi:YcnI family protein [Pseudarthrobacter sp. SSS035]|uniref:YcnI family copper-binding membrane protein n=1 Tax=Pseudarthrobacter sp. SSS035 TaxID=2931399 RepID=UPI00200ED5E9|nr:YcnI family protein [Pseudarthrobacter sp. SSS035]